MCFEPWVERRLVKFRCTQDDKTREEGKEKGKITNLTSQEEPHDLNKTNNSTTTLLFFARGSFEIRTSVPRSLVRSATL